MQFFRAYCFTTAAQWHTCKLLLRLMIWFPPDRCQLPCSFRFATEKVKRSMRPNIQCGCQLEESQSIVH